jgi:CBS domain containing-hemolysin-like protein
MSIMDTTTSFIAIALLLVANGFYVAAEFALVKARGFRIESMAMEGSAAARLTLRIQQKLEAYLATCQLGITMASLGLGWVGEPAVAAVLEPLFHSAGLPETAVHTTAFLVGFLIFSSLHIVIGEQVPKTFAIRMAEPVSLWVAYPLHYSYLVTWPLNWLLNLASASILSLFRVQEASHADVLSSDEIKGLVATSHEHGEIHQGQADMLRNLFEFDQRQVGRVMLPRNSVHSLDLSADPAANLEMIRETGHSRFPVIDSRDGDTLIGILLVKDIHHALLDGVNEPWRELKSYCREPLIVPESQRVPQLFDQMRLERAHMAFVIDEYGEFIGIITLEDLLEEIVGEIHDETDADESIVTIEQCGEGLWEVDGLVSLSDLERLMGLSVPVELDANTLSGLIMERLARMPEPGDEILEGAYRVRVATLEDRRVGRVEIQRLEQPVEGAAETSASGGDQD